MGEEEHTEKGQREKERMEREQEREKRESERKKFSTHGFTFQMLITGAV